MNSLKNKSLIKFALLGIVLMLGISGLNAQELLTLQKALDYAETQSPTIQQSKLNILERQKSLEAQRAALKSRFSLRINPINYSKNRRFDTRTSEWYTNESIESNTTFTVSQPILFTNGTISLNNQFGWQNSNSTTEAGQSESRVYSNLLYLSFNQPLFTYNRQKMNLRKLELNFENANISYALQRLSLESQVTQQFYIVYFQQQNLDISRIELENTQQNYNIVKDKADVGLVANEELYQAELNLMQSRSDYENEVVNYENMKDQLKLLLGMDLYEDFIIIDIDVSSDREVDIDLNKAIENGLANRMELRQREIEIEQGQFDMIETKASNEFLGELDLRLGITGDDPDFGNIFDSPTQSPSVGVSFNIPIFDWGERKAKIKAEEASMQSLQIDFDEEQKDIIISIREVVRRLENYWNQIELAKLNEQNAQLTYDISEERYRNGEMTGMDYILQQNQLSSAKLSVVEAQVDYKLELLNLKIQSLYDFENDVSIIPEELYSSDNK